MQIILTKEEYDELVAEKQYKIGLGYRNLVKLCTQIAETMPVQRADGSVQPWGCVLSLTNKTPYCDRCPVDSICPWEDKEYSK